ncbi:MAG: histidinol-phosphatase HisJ [Candidatus Pacearchaeota archaeon]|nr:histidinol-phosphatase HisJ [Candidatus Pacearchaeota archaeon]
MTKVNYHVHTTGSDGTLSPRQIVEQSVKAGIKYLCFTDHHPFPKDFSKFGLTQDYSPRTCNSLKYYSEIMKLKKEFKDRVDISFGIEFEYLDGFVAFNKKEMLKRKYDLIICSVHFIPKNDIFVEVPWAPENWKGFIQLFGSIKNGVIAYYDQIKKIVELNLCDCVGHFDLIKLYYPDNWKEIEKQRWYKKVVLNILDEIKKKGLCIEVNTSGFRRLVKEQYPSEWILKEARKRDIKVIIGNDFHGKNQNPIDEYLDEGIKIAKKVGYKSVLIFHKRKPAELLI